MDKVSNALQEYVSGLLLASILKKVNAYFPTSG